MALSFTWNSLLLFQEFEEFLKIIAEGTTSALLPEFFSQSCLQFWGEVERNIQGTATELGSGFLRQIGCLAHDFSCPFQVVVALQLRLRTGRSFFLIGRSAAQCDLHMVERFDSQHIAFCFCRSMHPCDHFTTNFHFVTQGLRQSKTTARLYQTSGLMHQALQSTSEKGSNILLTTCPRCSFGCSSESCIHNILTVHGEISIRVKVTKKHFQSMFHILLFSLLNKFIDNAKKHY